MAILWFQLAFVLAGLGAVPAVPAASPALTVTVDPRIELLAAVQLLGDYGILTRLDYEYPEAVREHFAPFAQHEAVTLFKTMSEEGFAYDAPPTAMLYLSDPPELSPQIEFDEHLVGRAGGAERLDAFIAALRDFARASDFEAFFASQRPRFDAMVAATRDTIAGRDYVAELESYYGTTQHSYHLVLAPLFHAGGYGPRIQRLDERYELFAILGPRTIVEGVPVFGSAAYLEHAALHEFGHSFVNPVTASHAQALQAYEVPLFEPIRERMDAISYGNWQTTVNEHLVRSVTTRMAYDRDGQQAGERAAEAERSRGFIYLPALVERLAQYEAARDRYPSFADFYPQLLATFDELSRLDVAATFGLDRFAGTINGVTEIAPSVIIIVPTAESDSAAQTAIHDYVRRVRDAVFRDTPIITDVEALDRDLSENAIVAYGTPQGNRWLARHAQQLPFRIEAHRIVADRPYEGDDLRLISAWPNPYNPARGLLVYTAQRPQDIAGINGVFHGPTDWLVVRGSESLGEGFYEKTDGGWRF
ncbi:MAG TPA: DUF4932 domain-containing protein [Gemmatimonadota bacterium]|nr:DUF4932 domain-containing protein [Gemmatimonadota bacterium]